jgi:hypothetical protein
MLRLQAIGCHNINLVSPSHVAAQIISALSIAAAERGLSLPLVYNTGGYDSLEALALLDGVADIYIPDLKYGDDEPAHKYSPVRDYVPQSGGAHRDASAGRRERASWPKASRPSPTEPACRPSPCSPDMNEPLASAAGKAVEVHNAVDFWSGGGVTNAFSG